MPDIVLDTTARDVVADVVKTLADATVEGRKVFAQVMTAADVEQFRRIADPLGGVVAGVVAAPPRRAKGSSYEEAYVERLDLQVAMKLSSPRGPGEDDRPAVDEMHRLAGLVRKALLADISRGGRCHAVPWAGQVVDRTEVEGEPRILSRAGQSFFVAALPVVCAWSVPRP